MHKEIVHLKITKQINLILKNGQKILLRYFSKEDINGQQGHKKMFNITNYQENTSHLSE